MIFTSVLLVSISIFLYYIMKSERFVEEKISLYSYNQKGTINYTVSLSPNELYAQSSIPEGNVYISDYVDYINTTFRYNFKGEAPAEIKGTYEVIAVVQGALVNEKGSKVVWKREFPLKNKTNFDTKEDKLSIEEVVPIKLKTYKALAEQANKSTNINFETKLNVLFNISLESKTEKGTFKEQLFPSMEIPLNGNYFEIKGNLAQEKNGAIEEVKKVQVPRNKKVILLISSIILLCSLALIFIMIFTCALAEESPLNKKFKHILKTYGDRMVAIDSEVILSFEIMIKVLTMEDLVRVADDICKPILYINIKSPIEIYKFYVLDNDKGYLFQLE